VADFYINDPELSAAIKDIGLAKLLEVVKSRGGLQSWIDAGRAAITPGKEDFVDYVDREVERLCSPLFDSLPTPYDLSQRIDGVFDSLAHVLPKPQQGWIDCSQYVCMMYSSAISAMDDSPAYASSALRAGNVDWDHIGRTGQKTREGHPAYIAHNTVNRLMANFPDARKYAQQSLGKIIERGLRSDPDWMAWQDHEHFRHIRDWLGGAVAEDAAWLYNLDGSGCPKKLAKCGSLAALVAEADKQMRRALSGRRLAVTSDDPVFASDGGEYHLVRLVTASSLDRESEAMRHCIGLGGYDQKLHRDGFLYLSLRDGHGHPHATIEVIGNTIVQFRGKANSVPKPEYREATLKLLGSHGIAFAPMRAMLDNLCSEIDLPPEPLRIAMDEEKAAYIRFLNPVSMRDVISTVLAANRALG
jgi:hypothetical protein